MMHIYKSTWCFVSTCVIFAILFAIGKTNYPDYELQRRRIEGIITNKESVTALVVGASHGLAILPKQLGFENGVNLCDGGTDLFEIDFKLRSLLPHLPKVHTVIISISYFSFSYDNASYRHPKTGQQTRSEKRREVYATFPGFRWIKGDMANFSAGKLYPIITDDHWERVFRRLVKETAAVDHNSQKKMAPKIFNTPEALDNHGRRRARTEYANHIASMKRHHPGLENHTFALMDHLVQYLMENGIRTIFVVSPYWRTYVESFPDYYERLLIDRLATLSNCYDVEVYNFSKSDYFQKRPELFHNSDHLHKSAYDVFCQLLRLAMEDGRSGLNLIHGTYRFSYQRSSNG